MNTPLFSQKDKASFSDVNFKITRYLHHLKYYDRVEDVINQMKQFREKMEEASLSTQELFNIKGRSKKAQHSYVKYLEHIVNSILRKNWSVNDHVWRIWQYLESLEKFHLSLDSKLLEKYLRTSNKSSIKGKGQHEKIETFYHNILNIRQTRLDCIELLKVIITKFKKLQDERDEYQILLADSLRERNEEILNYLRVAEECRYYFNNLTDWKQLVKAKKQPNYLLSVLRNLGLLLSSLNNLNIERNKMRSLVVYYPAFKIELFERKSYKVRPILEDFSIFSKSSSKLPDNFFRKNKNLLKKSILKDYHIYPNQKIDWKTLKKIYAQEIERNGLFEVKKETKIIFRALRILANIHEDEEAVQYLLKEIENAQRYLEPKLKPEKVTWKFIQEKIGRLYLNDRGKEADNLIESNAARKDFEYNWRINDILEAANFIWLTNHIRHLEEKIYENIRANYFFEKKILLRKQDSNYGKWRQLKSLEKESIKVNDDRFIEFWKKNPVCIEEINYYLNVTEGNLAHYNDHVNSTIPTEFKTYNLKNPTLIKIFEEGNYQFSTKYAQCLIRLGVFLEDEYESTLVTDDFKSFEDLIEYIRLNLDEVEVGTYDLLAEYLHSEKFAEVTDLLQVYGGAFGIYDFTKNKLIRIQDRKYSEIEHRPSKKNKLSKWYDLPERIKHDNGEWQHNRFEESVDLMFLAQSLLEKNPPFYKNLTQDDNFLNLIERKHFGLFCEDGEISSFVLLYRMLNGMCDMKYSCNKPLKEAFFIDERKIFPIFATEDELYRKNLWDYDNLKNIIDGIVTNNIFYELNRSDIYTSLIGLLYPDVYFTHLLLPEIPFEKEENNDLTRKINKIPDFGKILFEFQHLINNNEDRVLNYDTLIAGLKWFATFHYVFENFVFKHRGIEEDYGFIANYLTDVIAEEQGDNEGKEEYQFNILYVIASIQMRLCICEKYIHSTFFRDTTINAVNSHMGEKELSNQLEVFFGNETLENRITEIKKEIENINKKQQGKNKRRNIFGDTYLDIATKDLSRELGVLRNRLQENKKNIENKLGLLDGKFNTKFGIFIPIYKSYLKILLKRILKGILFNEEENLNISFHRKVIPNELANLAYDNTEAKARKEMFFNSRDERINKEGVKDDVSSFLADLDTQGLIYFRDKEENTVNLDTLIPISERYINLCKFIQKELDENKRSLKIRCDYPTEYQSDINLEKYLIDKQLGKIKLAIIEEKDTNNLKILELEQRMRKRFLVGVEENIQQLAGGSYLDKKSIPVRELEEQIASILTLLLESVQSFFAYSGEKATFLNAFREFDKIKSGTHDDKIDEIKLYFEKLREAKNKVFWRVKDYINSLAIFDISANFIWRANNHFAFSQLILPLASTSVTIPEQSTVGFLMLGFRNVIKDSSGNIVHINHDTELEFQEIFYKFREIYQPLVHAYMDAIFHRGLDNESVLNSATKAGVSRVMSRNMAHNIGSHVLARLAIDEDSIGGEYDYLDVVNFLRFLRDRMSFIADVSIGAPGLSIAIPFEKFVLEKISYQNRDKKDRYMTILLDKISGLSGYKSDSIIINYKNEHDTVVAFPNDYLGVQAIYIIIENIVRNSFKHVLAHRDNSFQKLTLNISIENATDNLKLLTISDELGKIDKKRRNKKFLPTFKEKVNETIIDPRTKTIRLDNWGILEMKIAAAYLRRMDPTDIDDFEYTKENPRLLGINMDKDKNLHYKFYLQRPKEIELIVDSIYMQGSRWKKYKRAYEEITIKEFKNVSPEYSSDYRLKVYLIKEKIKKPINLVKVVCLGKDDVKILEKKLSNKTKLVEYLWMKRILQKDPSYNNLEIIQLDEPNSEFNSVDVPKATNLMTNQPITGKVHNWMFFDHHAHNKEFLKNQKRFEKLLYYEPYSNAHATYHLFESLNGNEKLQSKICREIIDNVLTNIVILDERVQEEVIRKSKQDGNPDLRYDFEEYRRMYIFIPDEGELKLSVQSFKNRNLFERKLFEWIKTLEKQYLFIIIHITIIEKILGEKSGKEIKEFIDEVSEKIGNCRIILTSGRGTPFSANEQSMPFIPYSSLSRYLFEDRSKFDLAKIVYAAAMTSSKSEK